MSQFIEVILPLPIQSSFSYSVPDDVEAFIEPGSRVYVQFGSRKYYTGIVSAVNVPEPKGYRVKPIMMVLDSAPVIKYSQLKFWQWVSDYYLCTIGEVYKAAVPTGLKVESESFVVLNPDYDNADLASLPEDRILIVQYLEHSGRSRISDISNSTGIKNIGRPISKLLEAGIVEIDERAVEKYRPKTHTLVRLTAERGDQDTLHRFFDLVNRSRQQEKLLIAYLDLSHWMQPNEPLADVEKKTLVEKAGTSPAIVQAMVKKGIFEVYKKEINRFTVESTQHSAPAPLSDLQSAALRKIYECFTDKHVTLLRGITGSGKTEIYTHLIRNVLDQGHQVLYLVPEIALTTQLTDRLRAVFGDQMLVYHSKFSDNERVDIWKRLLTTHEPLLVLGVRSSVFLPFSHIGLVIVDEEHEASYKQYDPAPRYNARDAAIMLAAMHGGKALLGSATPSVETYYKAQQGKYGLVELLERYAASVLPDVTVVDMKQQRKKKLSHGILSEPLMLATRHALKEGRQAIMFQNRRGYSPMVICKECGWTPKCVNCDVSLVYHKNTEQCRCHYCGYHIALPPVCPECGLPGLEVCGYGTQRIAEELHHEFEGYRVSRMDLDTTRNKDSYQEIIEEFANKETDILVGTQMVSKGLDFENVEVVGVISADTLLNFPDFRSDERAFNMLEQVAGRAGRRQQKGQVIIQTLKPKEEILEFVRRHDYLGFYEYALNDRRTFAYPPFTKVINIYLKHKDAAVVDSLAVGYAQALRHVFGNRVLGPERPLVGRISNLYIQSIMLKVEANASMKKVKDLLRSIYVQQMANPMMRQCIVYYDVDPV